MGTERNRQAVDRALEKEGGADAFLSARSADSRALIAGESSSIVGVGSLFAAKQCGATSSQSVERWRGYLGPPLDISAWGCVGRAEAAHAHAKSPIRALCHGMNMKADLAIFFSARNRVLD